MTHLILILVASALLILFLGLTEYELRRGTRLYAPFRDELDGRVTRTAFVLRHVDFGAFAESEVRRFIVAAGHIIARISLQAVRAVERLLTRVVRRLHAHTAATNTTSTNEAREFVRTLSDFKGTLRENAPNGNGEQKT